MHNPLAVLNQRSFPLMVAVILGVVAFLLARNGVDVADLVILVAILMMSFAVWRLLVTFQTEGMSSVRTVRQALGNGQRATIIEFYSRYCAGCISMRTLVDRLGAEAGDRLQIIRLDIDSEPGRTLGEEYAVRFTPTFLYFSPDGALLRESIGMLDRARTLYDLRRA